MSKPVVLVSLDGLSLADLDHLIDLLPGARSYLGAGTAKPLHSGLLTSAAAIWGEILTATPWYENGCAGHAKPWKSLNRTKVVTEGDLAVPAKVLEAHLRQLVVNVPLLVPQESKRLWLSDGSLPLPDTVSPRSLRGEEPVASYSPRPYGALAEEIGYRKGAMQHCLETELQRLECANKLLRSNDPTISIIRLSLFDHIAHLIGTGFLIDEDLVYRAEIRQFLGFLDDWLCGLFSEGHQVYLISAFSHKACESRLNLNELLSRGGFLTFGRLDSAAMRRVAALEALASDNGDQQSVGSKANLHAQVSCQQAIFDCSRTLAASSVLGFVHVNSEDRFEDGVVKRMDVEGTRAVLREFLDNALRRSFGEAYSIWSKNEVRGQASERVHRELPDLVVYVPGAEFHNSADLRFGPSDRPRSVHSPDGFFWSPSDQLPSSILPIDICRHLQEVATCRH